METTIKQKMEKYNTNFIAEIQKIYDKENKSLEKRLDLMDKKFSERISSIN